MQALFCDANVLIDLEDGGLLEAFFRLPFRFRIPADLYLDELREQQARLRQQRALRLEELDAGTLEVAGILFRRYGGINIHDSFALALAKRKVGILLTGDRRLRAAAEREKVSVHGTLWVMEQLLESGLVSPEQAEAAFERMEANGRRLPWDRARELCRRAAAARRRGV